MKDWPTKNGSPCGGNGKVGGSDLEESLLSLGQNDGGERKVHRAQRQLRVVGRPKCPDFSAVGFSL